MKFRQTELYEPAVLALVAFRKHDLTPGVLTQLDVEVRSTITHGTTVQKAQRWLESGLVTPKKAVTKGRLQAML